MFNRLPPLKALRAFEAAARLGSFTEAAKELSLTQGAVSYQIRHLESNLGLALFLRRARKVSLTAEGKGLFRTTHRMFRELEDEIQSITPAKDQTFLTVSVSTFFVTRWLSQRMGRFLNSHPQITLRLQHSVNDPDFEVAEVDLAIRWGKGDWPGVESELLISSPMMALCSPDLVNGKSPVITLEDLRNQVFLHDQEGNDGWREWLSKAGLGDLGAGPGPTIVDPNVRVQSAIDGYGLVLANRLVNEEILQNRLVQPFDIQLDGYGFFLLYTSRAARRNAFNLFCSWLRQEAELFNSASSC